MYAAAHTNLEGGGKEARKEGNMLRQTTKTMSGPASLIDGHWAS